MGRNKEQDRIPTRSEKAMKVKSEGDMEYFCYISQNKVDQLIEQIDDYTADTVTEEKITEKHRSVNPGLKNIFLLLNLGIVFGKKDRISVSKVKKETIVQKLKRVIYYISSNQIIPDLKDCVENKKSFTSIYYTYFGTFKVSTHNNSFAYLESLMSDSWYLKLACSMKYFSDMGVDSDGNYSPHSGNIMFFDGTISPVFRTIFILQDVKENVLFGTPLFLSLQPIDSLNI